MFDFSSYIPRLGQLTAGLTDGILSSTDVKDKKKNRRPKRIESCEETITKNWVGPKSPAKRRHTKVVVSKVKKPKYHRNKLSTCDMSMNTSHIPKYVEEDQYQHAREIQQAIEDFKTQKRRFLRSLITLQIKLNDFKIPDLFTSPAYEFLIRNYKSEKSNVFEKSRPEQGDYVKSTNAVQVQEIPSNDESWGSSSSTSSDRKAKNARSHRRKHSKLKEVMRENMRTFHLNLDKFSSANSHNKFLVNKTSYYNGTSGSKHMTKHRGAGAKDTTTKVKESDTNWKKK